MMTPAPTFRGRLWRWTKRLSLLTTMTAVAAGSAGYFGLPVLARQSWTRHKVEKALTRSLGTPIRATDMSWSWRSGLTLRGVSTVEAAAEDTGGSFRIETIQLKPRFGKLLEGKLRATAILISPDVVVHEVAAETPAAPLPRFSKCGFRLEKVEIRDGSYTLKSAGSSRTVRIENIATQGAGRLEKRTFRLEFASLSGSLDGMAVTGKGVLRLAQDGLSGEVDVNEAQAKESAALRDALRAVHVTIKKAPVLSEPF